MTTWHRIRSRQNDKTAPVRAEILARYRRLREISIEHHHKILHFMSPDLVLRQARRLGLTHRKTLVLRDMEELHYACDLAIHTATAARRSRAIDRFAKSVELIPGSDEALVLDAMRKSRFSLLRIERRHESAGLIALDLARKTEIWLVDLGLESSSRDGIVVATRVYAPEKFWMTAGVSVPLDLETIGLILDVLPRSLGDQTLGALIDEPRFAEAIYSIALASGLSDYIQFQDMPAA